MAIVERLAGVDRHTKNRVQCSISTLIKRGKIFDDGKVLRAVSAPADDASTAEEGDDDEPEGQAEPDQETDRSAPRAADPPVVLEPAPPHDPLPAPAPASDHWWRDVEPGEAQPSDVEAQAAPPSPRPATRVDLVDRVPPRRTGHGPRARAVGPRTLTEEQLAKIAGPTTKRESSERPRTRGECAAVPRPCPYVSCVYHLYLSVHPNTGAVTLNFPDIEPHEMTFSCALDIADDDGASLEQVGDAMNVTRERVRQIEGKIMKRLLSRKPSSAIGRLLAALREDHVERGVRRLRVVTTADVDDDAAASEHDRASGGELALASEEA